ncbi:hypothetical protein E4U43_008138, partial [Claviceps pusilla]
MLIQPVPLTVNVPIVALICAYRADSIQHQGRLPILSLSYLIELTAQLSAQETMLRPVM